MPERKRSAPGTAKKCKFCQELIFWGTSAKDKPVPLDVTPSKSGTFFGFKRADRIALHHVKSGHQLAKTARQDPNRNRYMCHYETCRARQQRKAG